MTGNLILARRAELLLDKEPANLQSQSLSQLIDQKVARGTSLYTPDIDYTLMVTIPFNLLILCLPHSLANE